MLCISTLIFNAIMSIAYRHRTLFSLVEWLVHLLSGDVYSIYFPPACLPYLQAGEQSNETKDPAEEEENNDRHHKVVGRLHVQIHILSHHWLG